MNVSIKPGSRVRFSRAVIRRSAANTLTRNASGIVLEVVGSVCKVDFQGTWYEHELGGTVRFVPSANLINV